MMEHLEASELLCKYLIDETFSQKYNRSSLVLLAPLNKQVNKLSNLVVQKFPGNIVECLAHDKATACDEDETDDENIMLRFQPGYLAKVNIAVWLISLAWNCTHLNSKLVQ